MSDTTKAKAGHTPGPWEQGEDCGLAERCLVTAEARDICRCESAFGDAEANARLIAAAPDLAEALRMLMNICTHPKATKAEMRQIAVEARAALTRAGEG